MEFKTVKDRLFFFIMLVLFMPLLVFNFKFIKSGPLSGFTESVPDLSFTWGGWWDGSYQKQKAGYLNDSVGLRPDMVRLNNQIDYWLFKKLHAGGVYVGKDNYLFANAYTNEYYGKDFMGDSIIRAKLIMLKRVQDTLERLGKTFIFAYAPSKPYYYPDKIPGCLREPALPKTTNYRSFARLADSLKINQIDFNKWLINMKDTAKNILISKQGIHWSMYAGILATDTLVKYIEHKRNTRICKITITKMHYSTKAVRADDDLAAAANLIYPIATEYFSYPDFDVNDSASTKPKVIYIGDSFIWTLLDNTIIRRTNTNWEFWSHFNQVWNENSLGGREPVQSISTYNWQRSLSEADCIVVLLTPMNLVTLSVKSSFIDAFYDHYYPREKAAR